MHVTSMAKTKSSMRCGEVRPSTRPGKKIMKKYCVNGKAKLVHAGAKGFKNNYSSKARADFHRRHKCASAKVATPKHLACTKLWGRANRFDTKRSVK